MYAYNDQKEIKVNGLAYTLEIIHKAIAEEINKLQNEFLNKTQKILYLWQKL